MSYLVEPMQLDFLNNKDRQNVFRLHDHPDDTFHFKYVSTSQFKHIIKDVKRARTRKREENLWASLVSQQHCDKSTYNVSNCGVSGISDVKRLLKDNSQEIDQELRRLEEDALPETTKRASKCFSIYEPPVLVLEKAEISSRNEKTGGGQNAEVVDAEDENDSASTLERSPISRLEYSVRSKKSQSQGTLRAGSDSGDEFGVSTRRTKTNYRSERSGGGAFESEKDERLFELRIHPTIAHKILAMQKKVSHLLDEIEYLLKNIPLPDGDRDLKRRQQRVQEFAIRFSRNYLYDLGRQIEDINRHLRAVSPKARFKPSRRAFSLHLQTIEQKLISAHQLLLQALTAYCKHIPSSVVKGQPGKIKEILQIVVKLNNICNEIHLNDDFFERGDVEPPPLGNDTENRCSAIISKLLLSSDNESQLFNRTVQSTPVERFRNKSREKIDNSRDLEARLSMYESSGKMPKGKSVRHRKQVRSCTRERRPSKIDTTPQRYHLTTPEQPIRSRSSNKISNGISDENPKRAKIRLPLKEDEITTMISILPTDSEAGSSVAISENSPLTGSTRKAPSTVKGYSAKMSAANSRRLPSARENESPVENDENLANRSNPVSAKQLSTLVPVIADLMNLVRNENQNDVEIRPASSDSMRVLTEFLKHYRSSQISEIPSNDIATKPESWLPTAKKSVISENLQKSSKKSNVQLICLPLEKDKSPEVKNTHLLNETKGMLRVDDSAIESLTNYRDDYRNWSQTNPMYTSKSQNRPWDVVAWIADKLIEELIVDVSKEFEIPGVIQQLFELEFKEF